MYSDLQAMELPAFELDCRDWLVATPEDGAAPEEIGGAPVVAMLSTVLIGREDLVPGSALLSVGLLDDAARVRRLALPAVGEPAAELLDSDTDSGSARYVVPAPDGALALLAEFSCDQPSEELMARFDRLMTSFKWAC